jgi:hypothetical protein
MQAVPVGAFPLQQVGGQRDRTPARVQPVVAVGVRLLAQIPRMHGDQRGHVHGQDWPEALTDQLRRRVDLVRIGHPQHCGERITRRDEDGLPASRLDRQRRQRRHLGRDVAGVQFVRQSGPPQASRPGQ